MITFMVLAVLASIVVELAIYEKHIWHIRKVLAGILIAILPALSGALVALELDVITIGILVITTVRIFNLLRLVEGRSTEAHLYRSALRASLSFTFLHAILAVLSFVSINVDTKHALLGIATVQVVAAALLLISTIRALQKSHPAPTDVYYADKDLPTVSVLIPARNETEDLEACLHSIIASNYPKLEIVVLDDCSRDRTPEIIRGFAHDGVRFISGAEPDDSWLAKNFAYQHLTEAATGEVLLFCGVDTRFGRNTIRTLVTTMINKNKQMVSVMPKRTSGGLHAAFIQPMRYWWELALPRRYFNRPPVLSTCWMITHDTLKELGGFAGVKHAIIPEMIFARQLVRNDDYSFVRAEGELELTTNKSWQEQRDTAIRVRYPQVHRRPELAFLMIVLELVLLLGPFVFIVAGLLTDTLPLLVLSILSTLLLVLTHVIIVTVSDPGNAPISLINFPLVVLTEMLLSMVSMSKYEFSVVEWRGRNVCVPVMQVIPRLPKV